MSRHHGGGLVGVAAILMALTAINRKPRQPPAPRVPTEIEQWNARVAARKAEKKAK